MFHHYELELRLDFTPGEGYRADSYVLYGCDDPFDERERLEMGTLPGVGTFESVPLAAGAVADQLAAIARRATERWGRQNSLF